MSRDARHSRHSAHTRFETKYVHTTAEGTSPNKNTSIHRGSGATLHTCAGLVCPLERGRKSRTVYAD